MRFRDCGICQIRYQTVHTSAISVHQRELMWNPEGRNYPHIMAFLHYVPHHLITGQLLSIITQQSIDGHDVSLILRNEWLTCVMQIQSESDPHEMR